MARLKTILYKISFFDDEKTALHQWTLGLRQPFRLEVAKMNPKTLSEAEAVVTRLEHAMELVNGGNDDQRHHQNKPGHVWQPHQ